MIQRWDEVLNTAPAAEPISTADAKTHLRVTNSADDTYIDELVVDARKYIEGIRGESLINTTWEYYQEDFPFRGFLELPRRPLVSVTSLAYRKTGETSFTTVDSSIYLAETSYARGRVVLKDAQQWPSNDLEAGNSVRAIYVAGYGTAGTDVPNELLRAMYMLIGHWYENRSELAGASNLPTRIRMAARDLINFDRIRYIK